jgi:TRAP-type C4-dicarboxylate transport system permease small subunit
VKRLVQYYDGLIAGLAVLAGSIIASVCLLIVYDVVARNLGMQPPDSTVALTEYAMLYFTMAAAPWLVRERGHIAVEVLQQRCSPATRRWLQRLALVVCLLTSAAVTVLAAVLAFEASRRGELEIRSLAVPRAALFAPLVVGFGLMTTEFARLAWRGEAVTQPDLPQSAL